MAKARVIETIDLDDVEDGQIGRLPNNKKSESEQAEDGWFDFLSGDKEAELFVYRQNGSGKDPLAYLFRAPMDKYTPAELMDYLRDTYGGGDYRIRPYKSGRLLPGGKLLTIESPGKSLAVIPGQNGDPIAMALLDRMEKLEQRLVDSATAKSPIQQFQEMASMMAVMREVMGLPPPSASVPADPITQLRNQLGMMKELKEMMADGGAPTETGFLSGKVGDIIEKSLPALISVLGNRQAAPAPRPARQQPRAVPGARVVRREPAPAQANPVPQTEVVPMTPEMQAYKQQLDQLCMACDMFASAEMVADKIVEQLTEDQAEQMAAQLEAGDFVEQLAAIHPGVIKRRAWFDDVAEWLKGHFQLGGKYEAEFEYGEALDNAPEQEQAGTEIAGEPAADVAPESDPETPV